MLVVQSSLFIVDKVRRNVSASHMAFPADVVEQSSLVVPTTVEGLVVESPNVDATKPQLLYLSSDVPIIVKFVVGTQEVVLVPSRIIVLPLIPASVSLTVQAESGQSANVYCARSFSRN